MVHVKSIYKNAHSTIILDSQQLGNRMSVNSHVSKQKYIHTMEEHAQRRRMNYCYSQHGRLSIRPPIWKRTYCVTPCLWGSKQRKRSHSDRGTMGGIFSERGQEGSGREDGRFSILIWLMATQAHTYGKTHPAVRRRFVHCPTKKVWVAQSCLTLCNLTDYSLPGSSVHGTLQARTLVGLPCPPPGDLPDPGMELRSPTSAGRFFTILATREVQYLNFYIS